MRIFIYGTLLQGLHRHYLIKNSVLLGPGKIVGKLWDLGNYPGFRKLSGINARGWISDRRII